MKLGIIAAGVLLALPSTAVGTDGHFLRALRVGMIGTDVRALQVLLNTDSSTRVADMGPGSPGNETEYFGAATRRAVVKFQEKYKSEVLLPVGLTTGTGFFGESTRIKANNLYFGATIPKESPISPIPTTTPTATGLPTTPDEFPGVVVKTPSQYFGKPGTPITISGWGFAKENNTITFGDSYKIEGVKSSDGYNLAINVPSIPKGVYIVSVNNLSGVSQTKTFFAVIDGNSAVPLIESITPQHATRGDTVTIKGSGFAHTGNMLRTSLKVFENISSVDGRTLSFIIPKDTFKTPPVDFSAATSTQSITIAADKEAVFSLPIWVYVVNENGVSSGKSFLGDF